MEMPPVPRKIWAGPVPERESTGTIVQIPKGIPTFSRQKKRDLKRNQGMPLSPDLRPIP